MQGTLKPLEYLFIPMMMTTSISLVRQKKGEEEEEEEAGCRRRGKGTLKPGADSPIGPTRSGVSDARNRRKMDCGVGF